MTTILVEKPINALNKDVYTFWMISDHMDRINAVLDSYHHWERATTKHKWKKTGKYYDRIAGGHTLKELKKEEVIIPDDVKEQVRAEVMKRLVVTV